MWQAIGVTAIIFALLYSGILVLKRSADSFKLPKNVKPQPYEDDDEKDEKNEDTSS